MVLKVCNKTQKKTYFTKKLNYIAIALIRVGTCLKYKFLSEVCFRMIFSYFAIDIMDSYGPKGM
jgi:hypothetical protein